MLGLCFWLAVMGKSFQHSHQGVRKKKNKLPGNDFSVLWVSFVPNSVSAIKNMEVIGHPLTLPGDPRAQMGTLHSSGQAL